MAMQAAELLTQAVSLSYAAGLAQLDINHLMIKVQSHVKTEAKDFYMAVGVQGEP